MIAKYVVADRIQTVFDEHKLKDCDVAKAIGRERKSVGAYRRGENKPSIDFIRYLCCTYDIDANWLIGIKENRDGN